MNPDFADIDVRVPTIQKAQNLLQFEPRIGIDEGIKHTIHWIRENSDGRLSSFVNTANSTYSCVSERPSAAAAGTIGA